MISVTIQSPNADFDDDWNDLVTRAQPNVFMSPAALRAADATMFAKVHVLLAWDDSVEPRRLVGLWAMQERRPLVLRPVVLEALPFGYAFLSSPVIDRDATAIVISALLDAIADAPNLPRVVVMKSLDAEAASYHAIIAAIAERGGRTLTIKTESRPVIWRDTSEKVSGERRKKLRQSWRRMSAIGAISMVAITEPDAVAAAVETFLDLEFKSWKGAAGTALLCRVEDAAFARRLIGNLAAQGQAMVQSLQIDGQTIATQILLMSGMMAYTWKTAFDQAYAKFSPGVTMIDKVAEILFTSNGSKFAGIDSCSAENSFMRELWRDRRAMADVLVDLKPGFNLGFWVEAAWQYGREELKRQRDRFLAFQAKSRVRTRTDSETRSVEPVARAPSPKPAVHVGQVSPPLAAMEQLVDDQPPARQEV